MDWQAWRQLDEECANLDLILMVMNLPEMDGWEVARQLKADETTKSLPVMRLLTARNARGSRKGARGGL